jgi:putative phosphoribosyl transferase
MAVHRLPRLNEKSPAFPDRRAAGQALVPLLTELELDNPIVLAVPAGGVPVAVEIARATKWPLDVAVVSKITLPWTTEAGYGAVAYDGTVRLNDPLVAQLGLDRETIASGIAKTRTKVERRKRRLRGGEGVPAVAGCTAILVDDGLASGFTMELAVEAVRRQGAVRVVVAVPTGHDSAVRRVAERADEVVCANVRSSLPFAVADAYERWQDVPEVLADELLRPFRARDRPWAEDE